MNPIDMISNIPIPYIWGAVAGFMWLFFWAWVFGIIPDHMNTESK